MLAGCSLFVDTSGLSESSEPALDSSTGDSGDASNGSDAPIEVNEGGALLESHLIASVGSIPAETGMAQQQHLVYATNSARWWFFFMVDSQPTSLDAAWSTDFATWNTAATRPLSTSMSGEGRNFSVSYANRNNVDVVQGVFSHFLGTSEEVRHARATIQGATINYETGSLLTAATPVDALANPDGCVTATASDGFVYDASGWFNQKPTTGVDTIGREDLFQSSTADLGAATWTSSLPHDFSAAATGYVHNRALIPISAGGMLALWPTAETPADTGNVNAALGSPLSINVFSGGTGTAKQATNDWNACALTPTDVHAVRRLLDGGKNDLFEHVRRNASDGTWSAGGAITPDPGKYGSGVVLFSDGKQLLMLTIANDPSNSIRSTKWNGTAWSAWRTVVGSSATRAYLSGTGCNSTRAGVVWTEGSSAPYRAVGMEVSSLF